MQLTLNTEAPKMQDLTARYNIDSIIFDLGGTLWDTCDSCATAWNNVVQRNKIDFREITPNDVKAVTGLPHEECIRTIFNGLSEAQIQILVTGTETEDNIMIERFGGVLYPFVSEGLNQLASKFSLFIVSNCQKGYIETFLSKTGFSRYFVDFECWGNTGKTKGENLRSLIERNGLKQPVFVGDT
jgi:phosphoglycolate phosphatase